MPRPKIQKERDGKALTHSTIYTRRGDFGATGLRHGQRVSKNDSRIQVLGAVDELNCWLGYVRSLAIDKKVESALTQIQHHLFIIQARLAAPDKWAPKLVAKHVAWLEQQCDFFDARLPKLVHFILPGGVAAGGGALVGRAICRRAERSLVALHERAPVPPALLKYLNRLSDLLFILARFENHRAQQPEIAPKY